jgi:UPF0755 protein
VRETVLKKNENRDDAAIFGAKTTVRVLFYVLIAVVLIFLGRTAYSYGYAVFNEQSVESSPGTDVEVTIPDGASARQIGKILKKNGLIKDIGVFVLQERLSAYHGKLQGGTYTLNTSETADEMLAILAGDTDSDSEASDG